MMQKIKDLCKRGRLKEALQALYTAPPPHLLHHDSSSFLSSILQFCIDSNARDEAMSLHNHLLHIGYPPDVELSTKLVIFFSKLNPPDLASARRVFDSMPERSIVSWTAMISAYSRNGRSEEALYFFYLTRNSGFTPNQFTYGSALHACTRMAALKIGVQIQGCIEKSRFACHLIVQSALLDLHLKCGSFDDARSLFRRMEARDAVSWNSVIRGYAVRGLGHDAYELFCSMLRDGYLPDHFTFPDVLRACSCIKSPSNVSQIHASIIKMGYENHHIVAGSLIDAYAKCKRMHLARLVYDLMSEHDLVACTALINGYSLQRNSYGEALELFCKMNKMGMIFDDVVLCSMLSICADIASLCLGRQIHARALKNRRKHDVAFGNALIDMYAKTGELEDARQAFDQMEHKNVISWTSLITSYGKHGCGEDAIAFFTEMENGGVKPNDVTFLSLLFACSHSGLTAKGIDFFNSMVSKYGIHPRAEHYSCVIDLLARKGLLKEAYDLATNKDVKSNTSLWGSLLGACSMHCDTSLGKIVASHLFDLDRERTANYVVLANIYAAAGLWEDAWRTRKLITEKFVGKIAGYSCV